MDVHPEPPGPIPTSMEVDASAAGRALVVLERSASRLVADILGVTTRQACRAAVASVLRGHVLDRSTVPPGASTIVSLAEQFVLDANGVTAVDGRPLRQRTGRAGAVGLLSWLGLAESRERLRILLGEERLEDGDGAATIDDHDADPAVEASVAHDDGLGHPWPTDGDGPDDAPPTLQELLAWTLPELAAQRAALAAVPPGPLAPRTRELVRLTSADAVDCRYCRNVRYRDGSGEALVDEQLRSAISLGAAGTELGTPEAGAAVSVARAFLAPRPLTQEERESAATVLDRASWLDLLVTIQRFPAGSKAMVALGLVPAQTPITLL